MGVTEFGHFALISTFVLSLIQSVVPLIGSARHNMQLMLVGPAAAISAAVACVIAFCALVTSFIRSDFSVALVANHSHSAKPLIYKISGTWGNHEGSLLLWLSLIHI